MNVLIIPCLNDNYSYLIFDRHKKIGCVIDPGEAKPVIDIVTKYEVKLKYILNTHHHQDHVGGNKELKSKFNSKIIGFKDDKDRIPEIDILVENDQKWVDDDFEFEIFHIPGHTSGHICFYFSKEKIAFTGDTLFSLGCGRIFEGTHKQMFNSLKRLKKLPLDTKIYCGHEYTLQNARFCELNDKNNLKLKKKVSKIKENLKKGLPTIPSILSDEIECNIFLRAKDVESFSKLRDLKDIS